MNAESWGRLVVAAYATVILVGDARAEIVSPFPPDADRWGAARAERTALRVELADLRLHDVPGLGVTGVRARLRGRRVGMVASVRQLRAPVGSLRRAAVELNWRDAGAWIVAVGGAYHRLEIDGLGPDGYATASARAYAALGTGFWLGYEVDRWGGGDRDPPTSLVAAVWWPSTAVVVRVFGRFRANIEPGTGLDVLVALTGRADVALGFDEATRSLLGAVTFRVERADASALVRHHPVLGTSRGAVVGWER